MPRFRCRLIVGFQSRLTGASFALLVGATAALLTGCGESSSGGVANFSGAGYPNVDRLNSRHVSGPIDSSSVADLEVAWTLPLAKASTEGSYSSTPVIGGDVLYLQDRNSDLLAIGLDDGEVLWARKTREPDESPNGVSVADGRVYGATATSAFALDQATGRLIWSVALTRNDNEEIVMAPSFDGGRVYVSTRPKTTVGSAGGVGVLWGLDARTGKKFWHFDTVPRGLWGNARVNSGGGLEQAPAFDEEGFMYFGVRGPAPVPGIDGSPWGASRPGPNLYTNSIVKLNARTGKLQWYFQLTPHDLYGWDLQGPPILMDVDGRQLAVAASKSGTVIALDAETGKLVWRHPLGRHNGHDEDGLLAMRGEYSKLELIPTLYPGSLGGVIAPMSTDGSRIFAPVNNHPVRVPESGTEIRGYSRTNLGEVAALNARTGTVEWTREFRESPMLGALTSVNDLVFAPIFTGEVYAFNANDGEIAWRSKLPAGTKTGVAVSGETVIALADTTFEVTIPGVVLYPEGKTPEIVAYRLGEP